MEEKIVEGGAGFPTGAGFLMPISDNLFQTITHYRVTNSIIFLRKN